MDHASDSYAGLERQAIGTILALLRDKPKAARLWSLLLSDTELQASWEMANFIAVRKLGHNDHGRTHAVIATAHALSMLGLLHDDGIQSDIEEHGRGDADDAACIVIAALLCHDLGNQVHRSDHAVISVSLAQPVLDRVLPEIYPELSTRVAIRSFVLSAIYSHHGTPPPITIESALVCIGDAADMTKGRGRLSFDAGSVTIHTVSALAIESVTICKGEWKPVEIRVTMSNSAGIFQVQELLGPKVINGPLANYVDIVAVPASLHEGGLENPIVRGFRMQGKKFVPL
jgi:metal-dependent HD superfamily phosphatase/phosphodiesterase